MVKLKRSGLFQNPVDPGQAPGKNGRGPVFFVKFREALLKTEFLEGFHLFPLSVLTLGTAFSYYGAYLLNSRISPGWERIFIAAGAVLWSLSLAAALPFALPRRSHRCIRTLISAGSFGLVLGAILAGGIPGRVNLGLPGEQVGALEGELLEDPRASSGGNGIAALRLKRVWGSAAAVGGPRVRSSAGGKATVIFPGSRLEEMRGFGRKSRIYVEGNFLPVRSGERGPGMFRAAGLYVLSPAPPLEQFRTGLRRNLVSRFDRPENGSWGSLALALLLGVRDNLDSAFARSYREAGISHVLALSGMHLAVLSALIAFMFKPALGLKGAAVAGALFISGYVLLVGPQPSLDRAAIMYLLGSLAIVFSLARNPASLLNLSFLIQILIRPESGITISFILSYLALWGILHIGLKTAELLRGKIPPFLLDPLSASLGAFIATSSVSAASFGVLQPAGILAGLVIVPLTTLFMVLSLAYLALDLIFPFFTRPLAFGLSLLYRVLERLAAFSAGAPGIFLGAPGFQASGPGSTLWVLFFSVFLALAVFLLAERRRLGINRIPPLR
jgi:competence protein ComEC